MDDRIDGYATAVLELARAEGSLERVEGEFLAIAQAMERSGELRSTLTDPRLPAELKHRVVEELIGGRASDLSVGLVQFVVGQGRASDLPAIAQTFVEKAVASRSRAVAEIRSVIPLDEDTVSRLAGALSRATGKQVEVKVVVDPAVIGGIVARVGDTVIDGSVAHRVEELRRVVIGG